MNIYILYMYIFLLNGLRANNLFIQFDVFIQILPNNIFI